MVDEGGNYYYQKAGTSLDFRAFSYLSVLTILSPISIFAVKGPCATPMLCDSKYPLFPCDQ